MFDRMVPLDIGEVDSFWPHQSEYPMYDPTKASLDEWFKDSSVMIGMRAKDTDWAQGLVRIINTNGDIEEGSYNKGQRSGMVRVITEKLVNVGLYKDG